MVEPIAKADSTEKVARPLGCAAVAAELEWNLDILERGQRGDQLEALEYEPDLFTAEASSLVSSIAVRSALSRSTLPCVGVSSPASRPSRVVLPLPMDRRLPRTRPVESRTTRPAGLRAYSRRCDILWITLEQRACEWGGGLGVAERNIERV
jgi:hypothetical protein